MFQTEAISKFIELPTSSSSFLCIMRAVRESPLSPTPSIPMCFYASWGSVTASLLEDGCVSRSSSPRTSPEDHLQEAHRILFLES